MVSVAVVAAMFEAVSVTALLLAPTCIIGIGVWLRDPIAAQPEPLSATPPLASDQPLPVGVSVSASELVPSHHHELSPLPLVSAVDMTMK